MYKNNCCRFKWIVLTTGGNNIRRIKRAIQLSI